MRTCTLALCEYTTRAQAILWQAKQSAAEIIEQREAMTSKIEEAGAEIRASGALAEWFRGCDEKVKAVAELVNGLLFSELLHNGGHVDPECAEIFREGVIVSATCGVHATVSICAGAEMYEKLKKSGVGEEVECVEGRPVEDLRAKGKAHNEALIKSLREDVCADKLLEAASADAALGRMTVPVDITNAIPQGVLLHPRFGVEQVKEDGTTKLRPVDHLSWSPGDAEEAPTKKDIKRESVNGYTIPQEKMRPDTLDKFIAVLTSFVMTVGCIPGLFQVSFVPLSFRLASIP